LIRSTTASPCRAAPAAGTASATIVSGCASTLQFQTERCAISRQW
jgi:hypothetical protein